MLAPSHAGTTTYSSARNAMIATAVGRSTLTDNDHRERRASSPASQPAGRAPVTPPAISSPVSRDRLALRNTGG